MIGRRLARRQEEIVLDPVTDAAGLLALQEVVEGVEVDESVGRYCVHLAAATRRHPQALTGASPRGSIGLVLTARAWALLQGRDYVVPEDVKAVARAVLAHRISVKPELWMADVSGASIVEAVLDPGAHPRHPRARIASGREPLGADRRRCGGPSAVTAAALGHRAAGRPARDGGAGRAAARSARCWAWSTAPSPGPGSGPWWTDTTLHEGQGTVWRLLLDDAEGTEYLVRATGPDAVRRAAPAGRPAGHPAPGRRGLGRVDVSPRRWGRHDLAHEKVALTSAWGGFRCGPVAVHGHALTVLPGTAPFDSRAEVPQPLGLVGAHRSQRIGDGSEFSGIRPFHVGDRLRRINWRASLRSGVAARGVHPQRGGQRRPHRRRRPGRARRLRRDRRRVQLAGRQRARCGRAGRALRPPRRPGGCCGSWGAVARTCSCAAGRRHLRRVQGTLARVRPGEPRDLERRAAPLPGRRRDRRHRALADAARGGRHRHRRAGGERAPGHRGGHAPRGHGPGRAAGHRPRRSPGWPGGCGSPTGRCCSPGCPGSGVRRCRGAGRAPWTTCCTGSRGVPSCRRCGPDDPAVVARPVAAPGRDRAGPAGCRPRRDPGRGHPRRRLLPRPRWCWPCSSRCSPPRWPGCWCC